MKVLLVALSMILFSLSASAQSHGGGRWGGGRWGGRGGGSVVQPSYGRDYGPNFTANWVDLGTSRINKILSQQVVFYTNGRLVNEIILGAVDNSVQISSALAYLTNGEVIELRQAMGYIDQNRRIRVKIDYSASRAVDRIVLTAVSPNLIGSRGQLSMVVGYAY